MKKIVFLIIILSIMVCSRLVDKKQKRCVTITLSVRFGKTIRLVISCKALLAELVLIVLRMFG